MEVIHSNSWCSSHGQRKLACNIQHASVFEQALSWQYNRCMLLPTGYASQNKATKAAYRIVCRACSKHLLAC